MYHHGNNSSPNLTIEESKTNTLRRWGSLSDLKIEDENHQSLETFTSLPPKSNTFPSYFGDRKIEVAGIIREKGVDFGKTLFKRISLTVDKITPLISCKEDRREQIPPLTVTKEHKEIVLAVKDRIVESYNNLRLPSALFHGGIPVLKVSSKSRKRFYFRIGNDKLLFSISNIPGDSHEGSGIKQKLASTATYPYKYKNYEFEVDDIKSFTHGEDAANYREELHISKELQDRWITINFSRRKRKSKLMHIVADSKSECKKIVSVITELRCFKENLTRSNLIHIDSINEITRRIIFGKYIEEVEKKTRKHLEFKDIVKYSKKLNLNVNVNFLRSVFDSVCEQEPKTYLDLDQFKEFVSIIKRRDDVTEVWDVITKGTGRFNYPEFKRFMTEVQASSYSEETFKKIFKKFCISGENYWNWGSFNNLILSKYSSPVSEVTDEQYFSHPLNEYFISSSHNTYLVGRQVADVSSIDGYVRALQRGCRSVEIDIWDGLDENDLNQKMTSQPVVRHGRTFTTTISLKNVLQTIKKYAFIATPFPVIISLEVHCSDENQQKIVHTLKSVLGDALVVAPLSEDEILPSPAMLRNKFLIKVRKTIVHSGLSLSEDGKYSSSTTTTSFSEDSASSPNRIGFSIRRKAGSKKIIEDLSVLGVYVQGLKFKNFSLPESKIYNHCFSFSEKKLNSMLKDIQKRNSVDKHNRKFLMRVYPAKIRMTSSNFNPIRYWEQGVQMVATNWQTYDIGQQINEALFKTSSKSGYVLKPDYLRTPIKKNSLMNTLPTEFCISFNFTILSAHQLPKSNEKADYINPYVVLEIIGNDDIECSSGLLYKTSVVKENGFNPNWNQKLSGIIKSRSNLIFLRFALYTATSKAEEFNAESKPIAVSIFNMFHLNKGYRYLPLNDYLGEELIYSSLFVKIEYESIQ